MNLTSAEHKDIPQPPRSNVLAVEDNASLRPMLNLVFNGVQPSGAKMLDRFEMCETPQQALERLQTANDIDALMTDCNMPGMNGTELAREARRLHPNIVIILASSRTLAELTDEEKALFDLVIGKRFSIKDVPGIARRIKNKIVERAAEK